MHKTKPKISQKQKLKYYNQAKKVVQDRMVFFMHCSLYITVNVMLLIINLINYQGVLWVVVPLVCWGISLFGHFSYTYFFMDLFSRNPMQHERFERKSLFFVHLIVFVLTNIAFFIFNTHYSPDHKWFLYPLMGWGIGLFYHFFFIFVFRGWKIKKWKQNKIIKLMQKYYDLDPFDIPVDVSDRKSESNPHVCSD